MPRTGNEPTWSRGCRTGRKVRDSSDIDTTRYGDVELGASCIMERDFPSQGNVPNAVCRDDLPLAIRGKSHLIKPRDLVRISVNTTSPGRQ